MHREASDQKINNRNLLVKYAGMAAQWFVMLFLAVWGGKKLDQWIRLKKPLFVWLLPIIAIVALLYQVIKDTRPSKNK